MRVYTPSLESRYLLLKNIPRLNLIKELQAEIEREYNTEVQKIWYLDDPDTFTLDEIALGYHQQDALVLQVPSVQVAAVIKRKFPKRGFYGRKVYVQYAPEWEGVEETREKMRARVEAVRQRQEVLRG